MKKSKGVSEKARLQKILSKNHCNVIGLLQNKTHGSFTKTRRDTLETLLSTHFTDFSRKEPEQNYSVEYVFVDKFPEAGKSSRGKESNRRQTNSESSKSFFSSFSSVPFDATLVIVGFSISSSSALKMFPLR